MFASAIACVIDTHQSMVCNDAGAAAVGASGVDAAATKQQQQQQWISPNRVRRAVEATCKPLGGESPDAVLTYGRGLLQVGL